MRNKQFGAKVIFNADLPDNTSKLSAPLTSLTCMSLEVNCTSMYFVRTILSKNTRWCIFNWNLLFGNNKQVRGIYSSLLKECTMSDPEAATLQIYVEKLNADDRG